MSYVGIEIEIENTTLSRNSAQRMVQHTNWVCEGDGSLRGYAAYELKTNGPVDISGLTGTLNQAYPVLANSSGSWRAAVHVHVNMANTNAHQRAMALGLAMIFDRGLFYRFSPERVESNFCVPLMHKQEDVMATLRRLLSGMDTPIHYGKYSSVNLSRLGDLGTFEFRHMRTPETDGTVDSVTGMIETITKFARACHYLCTLPRSYPVGVRSKIAHYPAYILRAAEQYTKDHAIKMDTEALSLVLEEYANIHAYSPVSMHVPSMMKVSCIRPIKRTPPPMEESEEIDDSWLDDIIADMNQEATQTNPRSPF